MTATGIEMTRRDRLRRVVILCCSFARNLCYYRAGQTQEFKDLQDPLRNPTASFWRQVNGNFIDTCVMEWCKLFADPSGKHHWQRIVTDKREFERNLLADLDLDAAGLCKEIDVMRRYRDKFLAHLDSDRIANIPVLDAAKRAVWFYHHHVVSHEAKTEELSGLPLDLNRGYRQCEAEAGAAYRSALAASTRVLLEP